MPSTDPHQKLANALRYAHGLSHGLDVAGMLKWAQLKQSEQDQWLRLASAAHSFKVGMVER